MNYQENLNKLNLKLPEAKAPVGNYVATKISGKMLFVSGQISIDEKGELIKKGKINVDDPRLNVYWNKVSSNSINYI